jgi:3-methylfumaryl-CoA hydratase
VAEGYPGLVVHGPLQATQLVHFAERIGGRPPLEFKFRSIQPIFDSQDYTLNAEPAGDGLKLWTASLGGPVAMEARARW